MKLFILLAGFTFSNFLFSQDTLVTYLDSWGEICHQDTADFKQTCIQLDTIWQCQEIFLTGEKKAEGFAYYNDSTLAKTGEWISYYKSGNIDSEHNYLNGKLHGLSKSWHDNEQLHSEGMHHEDSLHGEWYFYLENGKKCAYEIYNYGDLIELVFWDKKGRIQKNPQIEVEPEYPGGEYAMGSFIGKKIKYPYDAYEEKVEGIVHVSFVVNADGKVEQIKIVESVDPRLDAAAMKAIKKMPKWQPGYQHNIPVRVRFNIPINFRLK